MSAETVELYHQSASTSDRKPAEFVGRAVISNLPAERFPSDLEVLAPLIRVDGKLYRLTSTGFGFGPQAPAKYTDVEPVEATSIPETLDDSAGRGA